MNNIYINQKRKKAAKKLSLIIIAVLLFILVNFAVAALPQNITKPDISGAKIYTLSTTTKNLVKSIKDEITIYLVYDNNEVDTRISDFLSRYSILNSNIKIQFVDISTSPTFLEKYTDDELPTNSVIVESEKRYKVISYDNIYSTSYSNEEIYYYYYYGIDPVGTTTFSAENAITSAIDFVSTNSLPKVYLLSGHGEILPNDELGSYINEINIDLSYDLLLISLDSVPDDADCIIINNPQTDLTETDYDKLEGYVNEGGNIIFISTYGISELRNFHSLMLSYGMKAADGVVYETGNNVISGLASYILPKFNPHTITNMRTIKNSILLMANSHAIQKADIIPENCFVQNLLSTSENAYIKAYGEDNIGSEKTESDIEGLFNLAMVSEIENENGTTSNIIWFSSPSIIDDTADQIVSGANADYFIASIKYAINKDTGNPISIEAKALSPDFLIIGSKMGNFLAVTSIIVVPLTFIAVGLIVCRKRNKI